MGENAPEVTEVATIHFDGGGQSPGPVTAACIVELSDGTFDQAVKRFDQGTHNTAEWEALKLGLRLALKRGERHVVVKGDSTLVVKQVNREWKTKNPALRSLRNGGGGGVGEVQELARRVDSAQGEPGRRRTWADVMSLGPRVSIGGR